MPSSRFSLVVAVCLAVVACPSDPPPAPAKPPPEAPKPAEPLPVDAGAIEVTDAGAPPAVDAAPKPGWSPPLTPAEAKALDTYAGFSADGLVFAATEFSSGAGLPILLFLSTTTNTVEKNVPIQNGDTRAAIAKELSEEGFPRPGAPQQLPAVREAKILPEGVVVTFTGIPASRPFKPFDGKMAAAKVTIIAVSKEGKRVALRVTGKGAPTEFGTASELHTVSLFE